MRDDNIFNRPSVEDSWTDLQGRIKGRQVRRRAFAGAFASIVLIVGIWISLDKRAETVLMAGVGEMVNVTLPDGTSVSLNSCSSISYNSRFGKKTRTVHLSGEAYFDVARDVNRPFIVETSRGNVTVHGTAFNVTDYASEDKVKVALERGSVSFNGMKLRPGEVLSASDEGLRKTVEDVVLYKSWMDRRLEMRSVSLQDLFARLSGIYNVNIIYAGPGGEEPFDVHLALDESIGDILSAVSLMHPIEYQIHEDKIEVK